MTETQQLELEILALRAQLSKKDEIIHTKEELIEQLTEELALARHRQFGRSSERLIEQELFAFDEMEAGVADAPTTELIEVDVPSHVRKIRAGRKALPGNLERQEIIHDLSDEQKVCECGCTMSRIGAEVSEKLAIIPRRVYVERHVRPKYACTACAQEQETRHIHIAPVPASIIPRGIATTGLIASILIAKFEDHLPFYRQELQFEREGIEISRQDMANWTMKVAGFLEPLVERMRTRLHQFPVINMDETPVQVLGEPEKTNTATSYMWLSRGGPPGENIILYQYRRGRGTDHAKNLLNGYRGYLQSDGYAAYDAAANESGCILVGCWAHVRRKFDEAAKASKKALSAREALGTIGRLYTIERDLREKLGAEEITAEQFIYQRRERCQPVLEKLETWLANKSQTVVPSSALGSAISYAVKQWPKLIRYLDHSDLTPDNNAAERAIRPFVLGRKNWLFSGSPRGAFASSTIYSLLQTAKENGLNTWLYLNRVLSEAPRTPIENWEQFLPIKK